MISKVKRIAVLLVPATLMIATAAGRGGFG